VIESYLL